MRPPAVTDRLLDALDTLAAEAAQPLAAGDWDAFAALLERESAIVEGLAAHADKQPAEAEPAAVRTRVAALLNRYETRARHLAEMAAATQAELRELGAVRRQMRAVRSAYRSR